MIILAPGGIGNQLFALAFALSVSEKKKIKVSVYANSRELVMAFKEANRSSKEFQNVRMVFGSLRHAWLSKINGKVNNLSLKQKKFLGKTASKFVTVRDPSSIPNELLESDVNNPWLVSGFFQKASFIDGLSENIKFFLSDLICDSNYRIDTALRNTVRIVGVHIRRGDYTKIRDYGTLSLEYFSQILSDICKERDKIIVASDELEVLNDFASFRDVEIISPKTYSPLETIRMLTKSEVFIMSNSTFSFWVGWLVSLRGGLVIRPNPWFKVTEVPENYLSLNNFINSSSKFEAKNDS